MFGRAGHTPVFPRGPRGRSARGRNEPCARKTSSPTGGGPYTGAEYIQSLRDGREVYIDGERVADVTTHPAFRNSVRSIARLYDALHDPKRSDALTCPTDTGSGGYTHRYSSGFSARARI